MIEPGTPKRQSRCIIQQTLSDTMSGNTQKQGCIQNGQDDSTPVLQLVERSLPFLYTACFLQSFLCCVMVWVICPQLILPTSLTNSDNSQCGSFSIANRRSFRSGTILQSYSVLLRQLGMQMRQPSLKAAQ